jgi:hypothetical protein
MNYQTKDFGELGYIFKTAVAHESGRGRGREKLFVQKILEDCKMYTSRDTAFLISDEPILSYMMRNFNPLYLY